MDYGKMTNEQLLALLAEAKAIDFDLYGEICSRADTLDRWETALLEDLEATVREAARKLA